MLIQLFLMNFISNDNKFCTKPNNQVIYGKLNHTETINLKKPRGNNPRSVVM